MAGRKRTHDVTNNRSLVDEPDDEINDDELEVDDDLLEDDEGNAPGDKTKTRGPTMGADIWLWSGPPRYVKYNERGAAVDGHCKELSVFMGCLVRNGEFFSICEPSWKHFTEEKKDRAWNEITKRFEVPHPEKTRPIIMAIMGLRWKQWKSELRKKYLVQGNLAQSLKNIGQEERVNKDQWAAMVTYSFTDKAKKESQQNQANRKKIKSCHALGTKSLERMQYQHTQKTGEVLDRATSYILSQTRKDGTILEEATSNVEKIKKKKEEISATSNSNIPSTGRNDLYEQALGKDPRGRAKHVGPGATATKLWGPKQVDSTRLIQENDSLKEQLALSNDRAEAAENKANAAEEKAKEAEAKAIAAEAKADAIAKEFMEIRGLIAEFRGGHMNRPKNSHNQDLSDNESEDDRCM